MNKEKLFPFASKNERIVVGLMSGTSVDGIDAALVRISGLNKEISVELLAFENIPFEKTLREEIFNAFDAKKTMLDTVGALDMKLGEVYAKATISIIEKANMKIEDIDFVGSHGQTVYHKPQGTEDEPAFTIQLGDGNVIAQKTGLICVSDFRVADIVAGGQGAPLVPYTEFLLYRQMNESVLLQNIGGIGNITVLPKACKIDEVTAFDTGPGNMIIDAIVSTITNGEMAMDLGGEIAKRGKINEEFLKELLFHPYFSEQIPKTTGRELFGEEYTKKLLERAKELNIQNDDIVATATALTAESIRLAIEKFILPKIKATKIIIGGGGSYNHVLISMITEALAPLGVNVQTQEELQMSSDAKEAIAFALLADCTMRGIPSSVPSVTGGKYPAILGKVAYPSF